MSLPHANWKRLFRFLFNEKFQVWIKARGLRTCVNKRITGTDSRTRYQNGQECSNVIRYYVTVESWTRLLETTATSPICIKVENKITRWWFINWNLGNTSLIVRVRIKQMPQVENKSRMLFTDNPVIYWRRFSLKWQLKHEKPLANGSYGYRYGWAVKFAVNDCEAQSRNAADSSASYKL